jgi:hypothetical protein
MTGRVFRLHSTLELPLEDLRDFFDDPVLPPDVDDIDVTRRNNTLIIRAESEDESVGKYTPTAQLKASVTEIRIYEGEDGEKRRTEPPTWRRTDEEPPPSELVEYAAFKGDRETVLQNSALQYPMFEVLREIALRSEKGTLTAITESDGSLEATYIDEGERMNAGIEVVEDAGGAAAGDGVDWRDNEFISNS